MLKKRNTIAPSGFVLDAFGVSRLVGSAPSAHSSISVVQSISEVQPDTRRIGLPPFARSRRF